MTSVSVSVDDGGLPGVFTVAEGRVREDTARAVYRTGARTRTQVRANASGRPGPRAPTGDYRRSISQTNGTEQGVPVSKVFTNAPQAWRLERGFNGTDALGRRYRQPPYPHFGPAAEQVQGLFEAECARVVEAALARLRGSA